MRNAGNKILCNYEAAEKFSASDEIKQHNFQFYATDKNKSDIS